MKWDELLEIVGREPVFHSGLLRSGPVDTVDLGRQLSRWVGAGKLVQIRRGLYALAGRYQKSPPHPFALAQRIKRASYVSLQTALSHYGLIPEFVPAVFSVTTGRPETLSSSLGDFIFRHVKKEMFFGYESAAIGDGQDMFIAVAEKALLDLLYLTPDADDPDYLRELRLQNTDRLNRERLRDLSRRTRSAKVIRAVERLNDLIFAGENR